MRSSWVSVDLKYHLVFIPTFNIIYFYPGKDHIICGGTNRGVVKILSKHDKATVACVRELPGVYGLDVVCRKVGGSTSNKFVITSNTNLVTMEFNK